MRKIFKYLEIDFDGNAIKNFQYSQLTGVIGDPNIKKYNKIEKRLNDKWKITFNTKLHQSGTIKINY